ncbi:iron transporter [Halostella sp. PRR32]|uniref:iron transporter n=1 Tax=Halostella sp. PRR32 TaxID=3098147 RepID=UPI002B1DDCB8|nr:iron transporter [Halostella sp. PRR32]
MKETEAATRRKLLAAGAAAFGTVVAGCLSGGEDTETERTTGTGTDGTTPATETTEEDLPTVESQDDPMVYVPAHRNGMRMVGMQDAGPYTVAMSYTLLHDFWVLTGQDRSYVRIEDGQGMHLMASVWDSEHGQVVPLGSPPVEVRDTEGGDVITEKSMWPMLSQRMGPHFGDNVSFPDEGEYSVRLTLDPVSARQLGDYRGRFTESVTAEFDLLFRYDIMNNIREEFLDESGQAGALEPMEMSGMPDGQLPEPMDLPGRHAGVATSADAKFAVQLLDATPAGIDSSDPYLAVSARTPYNRYPLPFMGLRATVSDGTERKFRGPLKAGIHPGLGYHYGTPVPALSTNDELLLEVGSPPQIARHRGYQTAFMDFDDMSLALGDTE